VEGKDKNMFAPLAKFTKKYRVAITIFWLVAAIALFIVAPTLSEVGVTDESQFLPQDTQSASARRLLDEKFPTIDAAASSGIIVFYNEQGLTDADMREASTVHDWLVSSSAPKEVKSVTSVFDAEVLRSTLVSADQTTMLMPMDFSTPPLSDEAKGAVTEIRDYLQSEHPNVSIYLSGEIGFFQDLFASIQQTIDRTTIVTVILVAILLLIIYRSPVAMLLPLLAIGCSFAVARGLLGYMGTAGVDFTTLVDAYLVVIIFGVGTDYCLFIVSRFREELKQKEHGEALSYTMKHIGPVIAASALTVMVAFLALGLSRFGMTKTTGYALAIGVAITLVAGLTLVPALMSLFGKYLFWPARTQAPPWRKIRFGWNDIGNWVSRHPVIVAVPIFILLLLPYSTLPHLNRSADVIHQMPESAESVQGYQVMSEHFPMGEFSPLYLLIESPQGNVTDPTSLQAIGKVAQSLENVDGVSRVDYYSAPSSQLSGLAGQVRRIGDELSSGGGLEKLASLQAAGESIQELALQHPGIIQSQNFQQAVANLTEVSVMANQVPTTSPENLPALLAQLQGDIYKLADNLDGLVSEFKLETESPFTASLLETYFSADKTTARVNIVLSSDPYSSETIDTIARLREATDESISTSSLGGSSPYLGGESATQADIMFTNDADFGRVTGLAIAGILVVIIILLRSLLAPLYMVLTVLLNYGATLGIATWLFLDVLKHASMIYMLPIFIFVVLVALGADYNIFLVSRIREEAQKRPIKGAVSHAVAHTGGVITACGIILAGTFATLTTAPLQVVLQIGAAIAIGVLVDTFIVRALLVPSLATLLGRWSWWPSRLSRGSDK
jgi:RND superfamily putative drug exporter